MRDFFNVVDRPPSPSSNSHNHLILTMVLVIFCGLLTILVLIHRLPLTSAFWLVKKAEAAAVCDYNI